MTAANTAAPAQTNTAAPLAAPKKEPKIMATAKNEFDFSKLSVEEKIALSKHLGELATQESQKLFDDTINFLSDKLKAMGRTKADAAIALYTVMDEAEKTQLRAHVSPGKISIAKKTSTPKAEGEKREKTFEPLPGMTKVDQDSTGARPTPGSNYKLADGSTYTKKGQGRTPDDAIATVRAGKTWAELLVKA